METFLSKKKKGGGQGGNTGFKTEVLSAFLFTYLLCSAYVFFIISKNNPDIVTR